MSNQLPMEIKCAKNCLVFITQVIQKIPPAVSPPPPRSSCPPNAKQEKTHDRLW